MRPVARGDVPNDDAGDPVVYSDYKDARDDLIERMDGYCSYFEVALHSAVDVEHLLPKSMNPALELDWFNFLLAGGNCNSIKGNQDVNLGDYYWPDQDNTLRSCVKDQEKPPQVVEHADIDGEKAQRTLDLTRLDRVSGHARFSDRDRRWRKRIQA